jgi:nicotinamide riboside kinase
LDRPFQAEDIPLIAQQQQQWEIEAAAKAVRWLFCDTGPVVLRVWEEVKFGQQSKVVEDWLQTSDYFLFLLCRPDLPWEADPLREDRDNRDLLFNDYQVVLERYSLPYVIIEGEDRLGKAMSHVI